MLRYNLNKLQVYSTECYQHVLCTGATQVLFIVSVLALAQPVGEGMRWVAFSSYAAHTHTWAGL